MTVDKYHEEMRKAASDSGFSNENLCRGAWGLAEMKLRKSYLDGWNVIRSISR
ncbi:hypothetical protein [Fonticella tunisiensis]|uniref:Uncharacterized protein n=1 Tax=Fonticella tunisiensis TaxID=1096341 RepID=A0A4R7K9U5_9CLOT|nr:hypothetical protein [Fonticella tunisiensis]TDT50371.1 hypothetical protein EDD71_13031 [Fonticella tunisiensis]